VALRDAIETLESEREQAQTTAAENARLALDYRSEMIRMEAEQTRVEATLCDKMTQIVGLQARLRTAMIMQRDPAEEVHTSTHATARAGGESLGSTHPTAALTPVREMEFGSRHALSITMADAAASVSDTPVAPEAPPFCPSSSATVGRTPSRLPDTSPLPCLCTSLPFSSPVPRMLSGRSAVHTDVASPVESDPTMVFSPQPPQGDGWLRRPGNSLEPLHAATAVVDPCPPMVPVPALFMMMNEKSSDVEKHAMLHVLLFQLLSVCLWPCDGRACVSVVASSCMCVC
jgi:hypothetical protein